MSHSLAEDARTNNSITTLQSFAIKELRRSTKSSEDRTMPSFIDSAKKEDSEG